MIVRAHVNRDFGVITGFHAIVPMTRHKAETPDRKAMDATRG
jgi:hypothetical protein